MTTTTATATATAYLCDACVHAALGSFYADDLAARMGDEYAAAKRAAVEAMGEIVDDLHTAPRVDTMRHTACTACRMVCEYGATIVDYLPPAHTVPAVDTLASVTHDGHTVVVTRPDRALYAPGTIHVDGIVTGHTGHSFHDGRTLTARFLMSNGRDTLAVTGTGATYADALKDAAPAIITNSGR